MKLDELRRHLKLRSKTPVSKETAAASPPPAPEPAPAPLSPYGRPEWVKPTAPSAAPRIPHDPKKAEAVREAFRKGPRATPAERGVGEGTAPAPWHWAGDASVAPADLEKMYDEATLTIAKYVLWKADYTKRFNKTSTKYVHKSRWCVVLDKTAYSFGPEAVDSVKDAKRRSIESGCPFDKDLVAACSQAYVNKAWARIWNMAVGDEAPSALPSLDPIAYPAVAMSTREGREVVGKWVARELARATVEVLSKRMPRSHIGYRHVEGVGSVVSVDHRAYPIRRNVKQIMDGLAVVPGDVEKDTVTKAARDMAAHTAARIEKASRDARFIISVDGKDAKWMVGKFRGKCLSQIAKECPDYLTWLCQPAQDFPLELTDIARYIISTYAKPGAPK
jgi:hypothetical protein